LVKNYKTKGIAKRWGYYYAKRWGYYYAKKFPHIIDFFVRPHPYDFGFAIYVTVASKTTKLGTDCLPMGSLTVSR